MADLFSVVAAGIGLAGFAVSSSAKLVRLIHTWRRAPALIVALANETSDLQVLLERFQDAHDIIRNQLGTANNIWTSLDREFRKANNLLNELNVLVETLTVGNPTLRRKKWLRLHTQATRLQSQLRMARVNINDLFITHLVSSTSRIELRLQDIAFGLQQSHTTTVGYLDGTYQQLQGVDARLANLQASALITAPKDTSPESRPVTDQDKPYTDTDPTAWRPKDFNWLRSNPAQSLNKLNSASVFERIRHGTEPVVITLHRPRSPCTSLCMCACHRKTRAEVRRTFHSVLGTLFVGYYGYPAISPSCDVQSCASRGLYHVAATYVFPSWLIRRALYVVLENAPGQGPSFGVALRRRVLAGESRLITAALTRDFKIVNHLARTEIASFMDVDYNYGRTALQWALSSRTHRPDSRLVKLLIDAGVDPDLKDDNGGSAREMVVFRILAKFDDESYLDELAMIFDISATYLDEIGLTPLHKTALGIISGDLRALLELAGPNRLARVNQQDEFGFTPLHWAAQRNDITAVLDLIWAGADVNSQSAVNGETPLTRAADSNDAGKCILALLDAGANIGVRNRTGWQALHCASNKGRAELVHDLLSRGADANATDLTNCTAILLAARSGSTETIQHLIDAGAVIDAADDDGDTAMGLAVAFNRTACFRALYRNGANYRHVNKAGESILHFATRMCRVEMLNCLADTWMPGLDLDATNSRGLTPMQCLAGQYPVSEDIRNAFERLQRAVRVANRREAGLPLNDKDDDVYFDIIIH
ncbi:ankyrin [Hypoxylon crocopeplum]|nr:ankyrin [Hypoxylon crocopeplum]